MIDRYSRSEMKQIWSDENKFATWLQVELLVCEALAEMGEIPREALQIINEKASFEIDRIDEIERTVNHDVIAFLTNVAEHVGPSSRYIHLGMTSSDLLDTSLAVMMRQAGQILLRDMHDLHRALGRRALEFKRVPCIGRSHGIHAEPTTFGLKLALWYDEVRRGIKRLESAVEMISTGKISGAVGTFAHIDPWVESYVCAKLDLQPAPVSTQIVQRDRHAEFLTVLALIAASLEKFATEIRNLQRTEILEVEESFAKGQKGSSAMPHKRNPITCERVAGLARVMRANALAAMENIALWHERDITHSSVERVIIPDSTICLDYMLHKFTAIIDNLLVYPDNMKRNIELTHGLIFSQPLLLKLARKGSTRERAYEFIQSKAMQAWQSGEDFRKLVEAAPQDESLLTADEIAACFDLEHNLRHVDYIFRRVGLSDSLK